MPVSPAIRDALKAFYRATGGAGWAGNDQWLDSGSECSWERVRCNGAGDEVNELDLGNFGLVGTLPTQIGDLSAEGDVEMSLWENDISGTLPTQFGRLTAGGKMTISLDGNSFSGTLPSELGNWQSGDNMFLWIYGNSISGTLPTEFPGGLTTGGSLWFDITDNALAIRRT